MRIKHPHDSVFIIGSTYSRCAMKKRLIKEGLIPYRCECGNEGSWRGKPLSLQIDHINGISSDNRLENLRFICPNCHAQTETYAGKNSKGMRNGDPKPNFRELKKKLDKEKWQEAKLNPTIRISEWGWKERLAKRIGIRSQKVSQWIARVDPHFKEHLPA